MKYKNFKITKKRGPAPYEAEGFRSGFVILYAVTISAILLAIALGVTDITYKEMKFSTNARDTNDAFFAADTGAEEMLYLDKNNNYCASGACSLVRAGLGSIGQSCAVVTFNQVGTQITIISKGYNVGGGNSGTCDTALPNSVEREFEVRYSR